MLTYCYAWTPLVIVGSLGLLALPWLGLITLLVVAVGSLILLAGLVRAVLWLPFVAGRAIHRRWQARMDRPRRADATVPWAARPGRQPTGSIPAGATALISKPRARRGK